MKRIFRIVVHLLLIAILLSFNSPLPLWAQTQNQDQPEIQTLNSNSDSNSTADEDLPAPPKSDKPFAEIDNTNIPKDSYREGELIVKYKETSIDLDRSTGEKQAGTFRAENDLKRISEIKKLNMDVVKTDQNAEDVAKKLSELPNVEYAEPNYLRKLTVVPNDEHYSLQTDLPLVSAPAAWDIETDKSANPTIVAVLDTGVAYDHEDLAANMWDGSAGCRSQFNIGIDGGCPKHGWNFKVDVPGVDPAPNDPYDALWTLQLQDPSDGKYKTYSENGHGTNVAGIIAGMTNNELGISGMSYHNNLRIMAVRFDLSVAEEINSIYFAANNGAKVINASFAGSSPTQAEYDAISRFPGIFVAAAGNSGVNVDGYPAYPCAYDLTNLICVGSHDSNGSLSYFSNYSATSVDLLAPGEHILGPISPNFYYAGEQACLPDDRSCYAYMTGTSQAAPHVAAMAGLIFNQNPSLSIEQVRKIILTSGDPINSTQQAFNSPTRMNLRRAIEMAQSGVTLNQSHAVYQFKNNKKKKYLYTANSGEMTSLVNARKKDWTLGGTSFYGYSSQVDSNVKPVYRFYKSKTKDYYYTMDENEKNTMIAKRKKNKYSFQGIAWYAYPSRQPDTVPVYRFYSKSMKTYYYTSNESEKNYIVLLFNRSTWSLQGISWYAPIY